MFLSLSPTHGIRSFAKESPAPARAPRPKPSLLIDEYDHLLGRRNAPLMLVEYGDYTCPRSAQLHAVLEELVDRYSARVALAYRHFPSPARGSLAQLAAEAAEAAAPDGLFWAMHARLMANGGIADSQFFTWHAAAVGLDVRQFTRALELRLHAHVVESHIDAARNHGVRQTPSLFINGIPHEGPTDLKSLRRTLEHGDCGIQR